MKRNYITAFGLSELMLKSFCLALVIALSVSYASATTLQNAEIELISRKIQTVHKSVNVTSNDNNANTYLQSVKTDGSFADINYADKSATNWQPQTHLDRLKPIVIAYTLATSKYYASEDVYNKIVTTLTYWHNANPKSTNWYMQEIACPQRMGILLLIMRTGTKLLPSTLETNLIERMRTDGGDPSKQVGANKMDVATHWIYRGCLTENTTILTKGVNEAFAPLYLTNEEGFQYDYSYHQHGSQLYLGGYGRVLVNGISNLALYTVGTSYALSGETLQILSKFVRETYIPIIRGNYLLFNTLGRGISRKNSLNESGFTSILNRMITLDPQYKEYYNKTIERLKGNQTSGYNLSPIHSNFWRSDYSLHQRPNYTMDLRMASVYTSRNENGNGENLKGYFLVDGATSITQKGDEYVDIFPVWDWAKIPGTTTPNKTSIPKTASWEVRGTSFFAGGVTDGKYGVSAYSYDDRDFNVNTRAKKSWFFFDDEVVCLGAGINSSAEESVNTTVNQTFLKGNVTAITDNGTETTLTKGNHSFTNLSWVLHNGIAYNFPQKASLSISNQSQNGTWNSINSTQTSEQITKDVFKIWFDHGIKPSKGAYSYIIVPNKNTVSEIKQHPINNIEILANTDSLQVVRHTSLNIIGLVFFKPAIFTDGEFSIRADRACTVMLKDINSEAVTVYLSDPARRNAEISLIVQLPNISEQKELICKLPTYPDTFAGSSFKYIIDKNTPHYNALQSEDVYPSADAYVRSGLYGYTNYGAENSLVVKKSDGDYGREVYIKFDLQQIDVDKLIQDESSKVYLSLYIANANKGIYETKWNINYVENDSWEEIKINWNNRPQELEMIASVPTSYAGTELKVDITEYVIADLLAGDKIVSLNIAASDIGNTTDASFYSKEAGKLTSPRLILKSSLLAGIGETQRENLNLSLVLHPNLAQRGTPITIETNALPKIENTFKVRVTDLQGHTVLITDGNQIETNNLSSGVYLVSIENQKGTAYHGKFILQ